MRMNYDSEKYPNLSTMDWMQAINDGASEYYTTLEHVNSMLDYLIDNPEIIKLLIDGNADPDTLKSYKKHIEQYGLYIYGFVVSEDKSGLEKLQNNAEVAHIIIDADY